MHVDHQSLWVSDLEATREFYVDVLGFEEVWEHEYADGTVDLFLGTGGRTTLQIMHRPGSDEAPEPDAVDHFAVSVDDVDATFERVIGESECKPIEEPTSIEIGDGTSRVAYFEDPDGYLVELAWRDESHPANAG